VTDAVRLLEAVAVMVQVAATFGAVKAPEAEMLPQEADQVTGWLAVNVCVFRACKWAVLGVMMTAAGVIVTGVLAVCPLPSVAVAVTVQDCCVLGAVKVPSLAMVPQVDAHVAGTVDVKWTVPLAAREEFKGAMVRSVPPIPERAIV
jgi:hypothetical protein